jgi:hypothetical protein
MKSIISKLYIILFLLPIQLFSQNFNAEITISELQKTIGFLASDSLKGRQPGTPEITVAANFIQAQFKNVGLKMLKNDGFQNFELVTGASLGKSNEFFFNGKYGIAGKDFTPLAFTKNALLFAKMSFVGYGLSIKTDSLKWDDYKGIDVNGKWVIILRGHPELSNTDSRFNEYSDERSKVLLATDKGASGVIFVTPVGMNKTDEIMSLNYDKSPTIADIPVVNITRNMVDTLMKNDRNQSIAELETGINKTKKSNSFHLSEKLLIRTEVKLNKQNTQNVYGILEGSDANLKEEYIIMGAHYDHLGYGGSGSGSRMPDTVAVHYGADDNASGVAGLIEMAQKLAAEKDKLKRSVIFVAFSAEELGLLGSKSFVKNLPVKITQVKAMVNLDMIGRLQTTDPYILISGTGTSTESEPLLNELGKKINITLKYSPEGYGASDHASFYAENIPVFFLTTGAHEDYHTPLDNAERINYTGEKQVLDFSYLLMSNLINRDKALTFKEAGPKTDAGRRTNLKVTLGIMPDFSGQSDKGLRADQVTNGGPASKAGMQKGDLIVAIEGKPVKNIYEYMTRLKQLQKGQLISVDVIRDGKKVVLLVQL